MLRSNLGDSEVRKWPRIGCTRLLGSPAPLLQSAFAKEVIRLEAGHIANRNEKPCQVLSVLSMIAWIVFGSVAILFMTCKDSRLVIPVRRSLSQRQALKSQGTQMTSRN